MRTLSLKYKQPLGFLCGLLGVLIALPACGVLHRQRPIPRPAKERLDQLYHILSEADLIDPWAARIGHMRPVMAMRPGATGSRGPADVLMAILSVRVLGAALARFCACAARVLALPVPCVTAQDQRQGQGQGRPLTSGPNEPDRPVPAGAALDAMLRYRLHT